MAMFGPQCFLVVQIEAVECDDQTMSEDYQWTTSRIAGYGVGLRDIEKL